MKGPRRIGERRKEEKLKDRERNKVKSRANCKQNKKMDETVILKNNKVLFLLP